jgi:transposase
LDLAGVKALICAEVRRVECPSCAVTVEEVPWAACGSRFTYLFEEHVGYLVQRCDRTTVATMLRTTWRTVGAVIDRVVQRKQELRGDRLANLRIIGVDELSYRRHHKYVTVVVDHERGEVVWAAEGKSAATLKRFFEALGAEGCAKLEAVTIDMSKAFIRAVTDASPKAQIIFDRFHVQRLGHEALDEVRRDEMRKAAKVDRSQMKGLRWTLQKSAWNLSSIDREKLELLPTINQNIYKAHLMKDALSAILDRRQIHVATEKLHEWIRWVWYSGIKPFERLARTILEHKAGILAYIHTKLSNGRVEGLNGKIRTITRRAYGFHSVQNLISMIFLCCGGITLAPPHHRPQLTH